MGGNTKNSSIKLYLKGFIFLFTIGGITGIIISNAVLDLLLHDTYFIIAHFHYVLSIGAVVGIKIGYEIYNRNITGLKRNELINKIEFYTFMFGVNLTFFPLHFLGLNNLPRRYKDYPIMYWKWQEIATIGSMISMISVILYIYNLYLQFKNNTIIKDSHSSFFSYRHIQGRTLDDLLIIPSSYHLYKNTPIFLKDE